MQLALKSICSLCFSATGTTKKTVRFLAEKLAEFLKLPVEHRDFTSYQERENIQTFSSKTLAIIGSPTYAGKLPNKILPDFRSKLFGHHTLAIPIVLFGNRAFDNSLAELCSILESKGFHTIAAGAIVGQHAFSKQLASGRPNSDDFQQIQDFAFAIADIIRKVARDSRIPRPVLIPGNPDAPYYIPKGLDGQPAKFLGAKPKTDLQFCTQCGLCAQLCPMSAINPTDASQILGICIKCQRCVRSCPQDAKYFDDSAFLSHVAMLEQTEDRPKENAFFLSN